jgi:hypothetical protein
VGASAAQTVKEIEETRARLDSEIRELEQRLPAPATWAKRLMGLAAGGGAGGAVFWFALKRLRRRRRGKAEEKQVRAVVNVLPERWAESLARVVEDGRWKPWAAMAASTWLLLRLAELRQLRRLNRTVLVGASGRVPLG